jgi:hypothetical protein
MQFRLSVEAACRRALSVSGIGGPCGSIAFERGYSFGGTTIAKLLTMYPERFLTATLGGAAGRRSWTAEDARANEQEAVELTQGSFRTLLVRAAPRGQL